MSTPKKNKKILKLYIDEEELQECDKTIKKIADSLLFCLTFLIL